MGISAPVKPSSVSQTADLKFKKKEYTYYVLSYAHYVHRKKFIWKHNDVQNDSGILLSVVLLHTFQKKEAWYAR